MFGHNVSVKLDLSNCLIHTVQALNQYQIQQGLVCN